MSINNRKNFNFETDEFELGHLLTFLYGYKNFILKFGCIFSIAFVLFSFTQPRLYTSKISLFKVNDFSMASMGGLSINSLMNSSGSINNQLEVGITDIIKSNKIQNSIINNNWESIDSNLIDFWEINQKSFTQKILSIFFTSNNKFSFEEDQHEARRLFKERINVAEDLKSGLVTISISMESRDLSVEILKFIKAFVIDFTTSNLREISDKEITYLNERIDIVKAELDHAQANLVSFLENNKNFNNSPELKVVFDDLNREVQFSSGTVLTLLQQIEIAEINKVKISPVVGAVDIPIISPYKSSPRRSYWLFGGFFFGCFLSVSFLFIRNATFKNV